MNINLIKHFLDSNMELILSKSLINCHAFGVDSILFDDTPGRRVRMFIANENHVLWKNDLYDGEWQNDGKYLPFNKMSVAFHPHHCDLELECIKGGFRNFTAYTFPKWQMDKWEDNMKFCCDTFYLDEYLYKSKINCGECKFEKSETNVCLGTSFSCYKNGDFLKMKADTLHTIFVWKGQFCAWMVYEGKEDPNYQPICYSNRDLLTFDDSNLYKSMNKEYLYKILRKVYPQL